MLHCCVRSDLNRTADCRRRSNIGVKLTWMGLTEPSCPRWPKPCFLAHFCSECGRCSNPAQDFSGWHSLFQCANRSGEVCLAGTAPAQVSSRIPGFTPVCISHSCHQNVSKPHTSVQTGELAIPVHWCGCFWSRAHSLGNHLLIFEKCFRR